MAIYKRGQIYWYKFTFKGEAIRESTWLKNQHTPGRWKPRIVRPSRCRWCICDEEIRTSPHPRGWETNLLPKQVGDRL